MRRPTHPSLLLLVLVITGGIAACSDATVEPTRDASDGAVDAAADTADARDEAAADALPVDAAGDASVADAPTDTTVAPDAAADALNDAANDVASDATGDAAADAPEASPPDVPSTGDASALSPEFLQIYNTILGPRCRMCHGVPDAGSTNLYMPDAVTAYTSLVNTRVMCRVSGGGRDGEFRVMPFDPARSVLPAPYEVCGMRHTGTSQVIGLEERALIEAWIMAGAR